MTSSRSREPTAANYALGRSQWTGLALVACALTGFAGFMAARRGSLPGEAPGLVWSARCESTCGDETALARASTFSFEQAPEEAPLGPVEARPLVDPMVRPAVAAATELPVPAADGSTLLLAPSPVPLPASGLLLGAAALGLAGMRRRKTRA